MFERSRFGRCYRTLLEMRMDALERVLERSAKGAGTNMGNQLSEIRSGERKAKAVCAR